MGERKADHTKLVNDILVHFSRPNIRLWKQTVGTFETEYGSKIKIGVQGMADIGGIMSPGRIVQVEVKVGKDYQKEDQKNWQAMIEKFGGIYILARSIQDVERGLGVS